MPFELTILGSNSAFPTSKNISTAQVLNVLGRFFLIDCAEGTQILLRKLKFRLGKINHIFISHLHGDHFFGLIGLISTFNLLNRKSTLHIYAPPKLEEIILFQLSKMEQKLCYEIVFHTLICNSAQTIYEDKYLTVMSFPLLHRIPSCGFVFKEKVGLRKMKKDMIDFLNIPISKIKDIIKGDDFISDENEFYPNKKLTLDPLRARSYAFCSDTSYTESIIPYIKGVDLLYHEATFGKDYNSVANDRGHSTTIQAANIAKKANVKKLVIGHFSPRYKDLNVLLQESRDVFANTELALEGSVFKIIR